MPAQDQKLRVIAFGAHPDDCEIRAGGAAALWARMGHAVKFVSVTNGDAGHHEMRGPALAKRRIAEAMAAARHLGVEAQVLDHHDGLLAPTIELRLEVIRLIREWKADLVLGPRPNDYHPDHRYTGLAVQDAAYMVTVPALASEAPALSRNPVFLYFEDHFQRPNPFRPDVVVAVDDVIDIKAAALDAHVSQFYEWQPWLDGRLSEVPQDQAARRDWVRWKWASGISPEVRTALVKWHGSEKGSAAQHAEAFEICEYGAQPDAARIRRLFPMLD